MGRLERAQLVHQRVERGVADGGRVLGVIQVAVVLDLAAQRLDARRRIAGRLRQRLPAQQGLLLDDLAVRLAVRQFTCLAACLIVRSPVRLVVHLAVHLPVRHLKPFRPLLPRQQLHPLPRSQLHPPLRPARRRATTRCPPTRKPRAHARGPFFRCDFITRAQRQPKPDAAHTPLPIRQLKHRRTNASSPGAPAISPLACLPAGKPAKQPPSNRREPLSDTPSPGQPTRYIAI